MKDFFISYNSADKSWAEWIAWQLEEAKYSVVIQAWDFLPGENFVLGMHEAARETRSTILVLSPAFLNSKFAAAEWAAAFRQDPQGQERRVLPVRVRECAPEGLLGGIIYLDLVGLEEPSAKAKLLDGVKAERIKPASAPSFPIDSRRPPVAAPDYPGAQRNALKGLRPFGFDDAEVFQRLQRERELQACLTTLTDRDFRLGILFGESGCGKTSFVQAGLWPMLPRFSPTHHPLYVKFSELDPLVTLRQAFKEQLQPPPPNIDGANFLELCTSASQTLGKTLVLFFDQFEQFFVHFPQEEQRQPFVAALTEWYRHTPALNVKILLSLRHDYYAHHHELQEALGYSLGPQDSMALRKFTPKQATEIFQVIAETAALTFDRSFVEEMTRVELAGKEDGRISPVDIQILAWMVSAQEEQGSLDRATFQKMGGVEGLLENYLNRALAALATKTEQQTALKIMLALVDLDNNVRAGVLTPGQIGEKLGTEVSAAERQRLIAWLAGGKVRLLTPLEREGVWGYELAHERLIQPLRRLTNKQLTEVDQANRLLERRVNEWLASDRAKRYLLNRQEMRQIRKHQPYLVLGKRAEQKQALIEQSRRRLRYRLRYQALLAFAATVLILWLGRSWIDLLDVMKRSQSQLGTITRRGIQFVDVPGGSFDMGDVWDDGNEDEKPVHRVTLSSFKMSKYEITNQEFCAFLNEKGNTEEGGAPWLTLEFSQIEARNNIFFPKNEFEEHPVVGVSWYGAKAFAEWLGGRLPTEAEWEYAARGAGRRDRRYPWGDEFDSTKVHYGYVQRGTTPVGSYTANDLGLYDMAGNVWEWCQDWYDNKYYEACQKQGVVENPKGPETGSDRVLRGGYWDGGARGCRSAYRAGSDPAIRDDDVGFRLVFVP